jgi:2-polyprenyl-6-methoxyphenol hydroxylase-like FAD-dependent oxidoreductase
MIIKDNLSDEKDNLCSKNINNQADNTEIADLVIESGDLVGITAALLAAHYGMKVVLRLNHLLSEVQPPKYARIDAETMRIYAAMGLSDSLLRLMQPINEMQLIDQKGKILLNFQPNIELGLANWYSFNQVDFKKMLVSSLQKNKLIKIIEGCHSKTQPIVAHFVLSFIPDKKENYIYYNPENSEIDILTVETAAPISAVFTGSSPAAFVLTKVEHTQLIWYVLPNNQQRWEFELPCGNVDGYNSLERVKKLLQKANDIKENKAPNLGFSINYVLLAKHQVRVLKNWHANNHFFAGEAAYNLADNLGLGLSMGIKDAFSLIWRLFFYLENRVDKAIFDGYQVERLLLVKKMIKNSLAFKKTIKNKQKSYWNFLSFVSPKRWIHKHLDIKTVLNTGALNLQDKHAGVLIPNFKFLTENGQELRVDKLLGMGFSALGFDENPVDWLYVEDISCLADLKSTFFHIIPKNQLFIPQPRYTRLLQDHTGEFQNWLKIAKKRFVFIRPDRLIFGTAQTLVELTQLMQLFKKKIHYLPTPAIELEKQEYERIENILFP